MHNEETQQKFIELRVQGNSFTHIATELNVSKCTLIDWSHKFQFEILGQGLRANDGERSGTRPR